MLLWAGLGNPEPGMQANRHNIGFMALDRIAERHGFSPWRKRFKGEIAEGIIKGEKILLLKPMTYMNLSGESIQPCIAFYKIPLDNLFVFHDEMDLVPAKIRIKKGGGAAGHNGLRSTDKMLGSQDYWRVRLGIGHPEDRSQVVRYVLGDFSKQDREWLDPFIDAVAEKASLLTERKMDAYLSKVALLLKG
ncbi:aminoacyl-tRNA hydrolase [Commensalibacter sp. M0402]|uniref:aminoacyl-tRNA hydrolase n=1 Tax=Commensalibacter TaxID=1079922 RepID=UPI0018DC61E1|nr:MULTISPECIES: aminoacyl-tRNA hydrolase [Commensalibacter]MBI0083760.1 aminoacyl-tRNA hydrolase [Commensalibacter sp. W6292M3]MBI0088996.1 aminoacyl-tRNA hydrolase [Commensalibacter melissae]